MTHSRMTLALASARVRTLAFKQTFRSTPTTPGVSYDEKGDIQGTPTPTMGVVVAATVVVALGLVVVIVMPIPVLLVLGDARRVTQVPPWQPLPVAQR